MSDLEATRDHARRLSTADHDDDCENIHRITKVDRRLYDCGLDATLSGPDTSGHYSHDWSSGNGLGWYCPGLCGGCGSDSERALWTQIADEIDAYLTPEDDGPDLFEEDA